MILESDICILLKWNLFWKYSEDKIAVCDKTSRASMEPEVFGFELSVLESISSRKKYKFNFKTCSLKIVF